MSRKEEHLDNVAAVILGAFECSEAEKPFLEMLEQKYEALRILVLTHALKEEHGLAWDRSVLSPPCGCSFLVTNSGCVN